MGEINWYLGFEIKRDKTAGTISINQRSYIESMLERFKLMDANPTTLPIKPGVQLAPVESQPCYKETMQTRERPYAEAISSVLWAAMISRPDIAYT